MTSKSLLCVLLLTAASACIDGDRGIHDGMCPPGEVCSVFTPRGLAFRGATLGEALPGFSVASTAVGGSQTITLIDLDTGTPLTVPWRADVSGALAVAAQSGSDVSIRGVAAGSAQLRIVDPPTGELHDRFTLRAAPIGAISISSGAELLSPGRTVSWIAGADIDATIVLADAAGARLVDDQLTVALAEPAGVVLERRSWDRVLVRGAGVGPVALIVSAGTVREHRVETTVVDDIDAVVAGLPAPEARPFVGERHLYCFEARRGDRLVLGLAWAFAVDGSSVEDRQDASNCVGFTVTAPSVVTITATAAGRSVRREIVVGPRTTRSRDGAVAADPEDLDIGSPGDRARSTR